ncbi:MAG: IS1 family transposase [Bacteroidaceae bacterium]|nr:IS1 family transposase [Bacteroidaceae bacterium]
MVHNGFRDGKQRYKCKECGRRFTGGIRRDKSQVITDYVDGKQTIIQLAAKYKVSERTIRRDLESMRFLRKKAKYKEVTVQLDTTYWGRKFGLMVIKDALRNKVLWHKYVYNETINQYMEGISWLESQGFKIYGAVIDGMRGLAQALYPIPVQMCQFHQILITRRYLTQEPDLNASCELLSLVKNITQMDKESFIGAFNEWHDKYKDVLNERIHDKRIKRHSPPYMRPRLRSAYLSLKRNMPLLWTFYDHPETGLPNTNNAIEGLFSDIKSKLRAHRGISKDNRKKLLDEYIMRHY